MSEDGGVIHNRFVDGATESCNFNTFFVFVLKKTNELFVRNRKSQIYRNRKILKFIPEIIST